MPTYNPWLLPPTAKMRYLLTVLSLASLALAQYNISTMYGLGNDLANHSQVPSMLEIQNSRHFQFSLLNVHAYGFSPDIEQDALFDFLSMSKDDTLRLGDPRRKALIDALDNRIMIAGGLELQPFAMAYQFGKLYKTTLSFTYRPRIGFNLTFSDDFVDFALNGNKQYRGTTVDLVKALRVSSFFTHEFALGGAFDLPVHLWALNPRKRRLRIGGRLKYYSVAAASYLNDPQATLRTAVDGSELEIKVNGDLRQSGFNDNFNGFDGAGTGYGADISVSHNLNAYTRISAAMVDIGRLSIVNATAYAINQNLLFEGFELGVDFFDNRANIEIKNEEFDFESREVKNQRFSMPLPTRMILAGETGFVEKTDKREVKYALHNAYLTYIQGFGNTAGRSVRPFVAVGYRANLRNRLSLGTNITALSPGGFTAGAFLAVHTPLFNYSLGSANLLNAVTGNWLRGSDLAMNMSFSF